MPGAARMGTAERADAWHELAPGEFDVLVVGGGVTGAGAALDAVSRGLRVALVEARDFASGTSSRSSKLIHGGLRYLEQLDFALVREALRERELMLTRLAPHLVKPASFLYPLRHRVWERAYVGAGLVLYDTMGGARSLPRHRHLGRTGVRRLAPALRPSVSTGGLRYYDAQADDARHTLTVVRTAVSRGAVALNSAEAVDFLHEQGRVVGARIRDVESGAETDVRAHVVVNATGVWTDAVQRIAGGGAGFRVRASKGVHVVVPRERIDLQTGLILRTERSVLFVIPWKRDWIVGTTDTDWNLDLAHPAASRADVDYILARLNAVLREPLTRQDVLGVYAGLRPLLAGESERTSRLSREHAVARPRPGLVTVAGGKYTTYRVMAADAVDLARADIPRPVPDSATADLPLLGAHGYRALVEQVESLARTYGLPAWQIRRLLDRYGSLLPEVLAAGERDRALLERLDPAVEYLGAELAYAASHEAALHLDDLLARRTRASIETPRRGVRIARAAAEIVAPLLRWDAERVDNEVAAYEARVRAERDAQQQADDLAADAARVAAPDTRRVAVGRTLQ